MLKRAGWQVGKNVVYRLYREEGLYLRTKGPVAVRWQGIDRRTISRPGQTKHGAWRMDFVHDQLASDSKLHLLTVIGVSTREALAIEVGPNLRGEQVVTVLNRLIYLRGAPKAVFLR